MGWRLTLFSLPSNHLIAVVHDVPGRRAQAGGQEEGGRERGGGEPGVARRGGGAAAVGPEDSRERVTRLSGSERARRRCRGPPPRPWLSLEEQFLAHAYLVPEAGGEAWPVATAARVARRGVGAVRAMGKEFFSTCVWGAKRAGGQLPVTLLSGLATLSLFIRRAPLRGPRCRRPCCAAAAPQLPPPALAHRLRSGHRLLLLPLPAAQSAAPLLPLAPSPWPPPPRRPPASPSAAA